MKILPCPKLRLRAVINLGNITNNMNWIQVRAICLWFFLCIAFFCCIKVRFTRATKLLNLRQTRPYVYKNVVIFWTKQRNYCSLLKDRWSSKSIPIEEKFWKVLVLFVGPLMPLFWTLGDVCLGSESQCGSYCLHALSPVCTRFLKSQSGATPTELLVDLSCSPLTFKTESLFKLSRK